MKFLAILSLMSVSFSASAAPTCTVDEAIKTPEAHLVFEKIKSDMTNFLRSDFDATWLPNRGGSASKDLTCITNCQIKIYLRKDEEASYFGNRYLTVHSDILTDNRTRLTGKNTLIKIWVKENVKTSEGEFYQCVLYTKTYSAGNIFFAKTGLEAKFLQPSHFPFDPSVDGFFEHLKESDPFWNVTPINP